MSNYTKTVDFASKDTLPSGDSGKIIKGTEFETQFDNIATAVATKADSAAPTFTGTSVFANLDISGDIDVDGTTNLDAVDIDGAVQADGTVTVGVDDTGYDVKFFGATSGKSLLWDESADSLIVTGTTTMTGNSTISGTLGVTGVLTGTSLDISGDIDVDGTTNLDVVDIDGAVDFASTTAHAGNATFADNARLQLGTGTDLQIYHNGSDSFIADNGVGDFYISGSSNIIFRKSGSSEVKAKMITDGAVELYYDNAVKLATTATGVDITGVITTDGIAVTGIITATGTSVFTNLDISGDIDVDGTTNLDVVDIDGAVDMASTLTVAGAVTGSSSFATAAGGTFTTASGNDLNLVYPEGRSLFFKEAGTTTLTLDNVQGATFAGAVAVAGDYSSTTLGTSNLRLGVNAGNSIVSGGNYNTVVGDEAGTAITTGDENTFIGYQSGDGTTTAEKNTAVGTYSLGDNTTGSYNVAVGRQALKYNTTASNNTAVGYHALQVNTTGSNNSAVGYSAGDSITTGGYNSLLGHSSGTALTEGVRNVCIGDRAGVNITTGDDNIMMGANNNASAADANNNIVIGFEVTGVGANNFTFGNTSTDSNIAFGATSITAPSDERMKEDVVSSTAGLSFVNDLRPVTYKWKKEKDLPNSMNAYVEGSEKRVINDTTNHGFIAQEVKSTIDAHPEIKDGFDMWMEKDSDGQQRVAPSALIPILTKAIQEQQALIESLTARITTLEG